MSTSFAHKLDQWQGHARAAHQRSLDAIAADEALRERIWADDGLLLSAIRRMGQDDILIGDAIDAYHAHLKQLAEHSRNEL